MCAFVRICMRECACLTVSVCAIERVCMCVCMCVHVYMCMCVCAYVCDIPMSGHSSHQLCRRCRYNIVSHMSR